MAVTAFISAADVAACIMAVWAVISASCSVSTREIRSRVAVMATAVDSIVPYSRSTIAGFSTIRRRRDTKSPNKAVRSYFFRGSGIASSVVILWRMAFRDIERKNSFRH